MHVAVLGNLSEGLRITGPYPDFSEAAHSTTGMECWIMELHAPIGATEVNPLPIGCAARYAEIERRAKKLMMTFVSGNKNDTAIALNGMEPKAALAVLSEMMMHGPDIRESLNRYLKEVA